MMTRREDGEVADFLQRGARGVSLRTLIQLGAAG